MSTLLSVVTGSYNEEGNVDEWFERVFATLSAIKDLDIEILWVDNASQDGTVAKVKVWCARDARVKLIVNARNFGPIRSPFHGVMQAKGDAVVYLASDLQDTPELLADFVQAWRDGADVVAGVYKKTQDGFVMSLARKTFYAIMRAASEAQAISAFTGFGLYSRKVVELLRQTGGPMPYVRGLVAEFGLPWRAIAYDKPKRKYGVSKNDILGLVDQAILGLTTMSRAPIRFATLLGFGMSCFGFALALGYLVAKLLFWESFPMGQAPLLIGIFLFASVQIMIVGLIGEYVAAMHLRLQNKPWVIELERVNFDGPQQKT
jgi:glycosyltransferase involved in cell wall biosynthesis